MSVLCTKVSSWILQLIRTISFHWLFLENQLHMAKISKSSLQSKILYVHQLLSPSHLCWSLLLTVGSDMSWGWLLTSCGSGCLSKLRRDLILRSFSSRPRGHLCLMNGLANGSKTYSAVTNAIREQLSARWHFFGCLGESRQKQWEAWEMKEGLHQERWKTLKSREEFKSCWS